MMGDTQCLLDISYPTDVPCPGSLPSSDLFSHFCDLCLSSYLHLLRVPVLLLKISRCLGNVVQSAVINL